MPQQQASSDEGEDPHNHSDSHTRQEGGAVTSVVMKEVVQQMCIGKCREQHRQSTQDVQNSHYDLPAFLRTQSSH